MSTSKKLKSIANLSKHFWLHVARRAVNKPKPGEEKAKFLSYYAPDKLVPLDEADRVVLDGAKRCINCGTCSSVCPIYGPAAHGSYRAPDSIAASLTRSFPEFGAARDAVFNCVQCGACASSCPTSVDVPSLVMLCRKKAAQADPGAILSMHASRLDALEKYGNVHGRGAEKFDSFKKDRASYVYFAGCGESVLSAMETEKTLMLLQRLGVDFTVVSGTCCGSFHRSAGMLDGDNSLVHTLIEKIRACGTNKVIVSCPHGLHTMLTHPEYRAHIEPVHVAEFVAGLDFTAEKFREIVTYHDPCFLGRRCGIYDAPRELIARAGAKIIEMPRNRGAALCCGSASGEFPPDTAVADALAAERMEEAKSTGAPIVLTSCPACLRSLSSAPSALPVMTVTSFLLDKLAP